MGIFMLFPLGIGLIYKDESPVPFLESIAISIITGGILFLFSKTKGDDNKYMSQREGMAIVALGWIAIGLSGALPFYFSNQFGSFTDSFFESVSGFTTTGSSILTDIEAIPKGMLFWRSFIQWLGGMGIIVLSLAILPFLGVGGMQLYKAEVPSPVPDKLNPEYGIPT